MGAVLCLAVVAAGWVTQPEGAATVAAPNASGNQQPVGTTVDRVASTHSPTNEPVTAQSEQSPPEPQGTVVAHAVADTIEARTEPNSAAEVVATLQHPTPRGGPLVFQALGLPENGWIEVQLPVRPNGTTGWIPAGQVELSRNPYRIDIDLTEFTLVVSKHGDPVVAASIGVGDTDTPTPIGDFYLIELLRPPDPDGPYGSYAYGLSGYSEVLDQFAGGDGVIGIHGTNQPDLLNQQVSHGCIRLENAVIEELAEFLPLGTPVSIAE
jgi:lipoprotein-anchoring transpeptidase ErfK/SrfK